VTDLDTALCDAVAQNHVPFAVGMVGNSNDIAYSVAAGEDTAFRIFSMTEAIGSLAAMILIDRESSRRTRPRSRRSPSGTTFRFSSAGTETRRRCARPSSAT